ncbi:MAG: STAS/SEC14 domain-containing protein [Rhodobacterales bacterium]|nr:STAS/SEC14 domain-containing protein [Puniceibacterium antarcticum]
MQTFAHGPIKQIPTDNPKVYAFRISGRIDDDASEAMAKYMNTVFDETDKVNMLLDLSDFTGSDWDSMLDGDVIQSRFRALSHVAKYAVIGAPDSAASMIGFMDKIIPVEAKAFDKTEETGAWNFVDARPVTA